MMGTAVQLSMLLVAAAWAVGAMGLAAAMHDEPWSAHQAAYYSLGQEPQLNSQQKKEFNLGMASRESDITDGSQQRQQPAPLRYPVWWHAPIWSGSGYSSEVGVKGASLLLKSLSNTVESIGTAIEAVNYMLSMLRAGTLQPRDLWVGHHGDEDRKAVREAMHPQDRRDLEAMEGQVNKTRPAIIVCHSLPSNWMYPAPLGWVGKRCPPDPREQPYVFTIGRTMFETDKLPAAFVARCNAMNEVWVPSDFSKDVFIASGVVASKIRVVPEGVNTTLFDPTKHAPMPLPQGDLVFGTPAPPTTPDAQLDTEGWGRHAAEKSLDAADTSADHSTSYSQHPPSRVVALDINRAASIKVKHSSGAVTSAPGAGGNARRHLLAVPNRAVDLHATRKGASDVASMVPGAGTATNGPDGAGDQPGTSDLTSASARDSNSASDSNSVSTRRPYRFLSTFKWESRKGWDVLLGAYLQAFTADDPVELYIITKPFQGASNFRHQMQQWAEKEWVARQKAAEAEVAKAAESAAKSVEASTQSDPESSHSSVAQSDGTPLVNVAPAPTSFVPAPSFDPSKQKDTVDQAPPTTATTATTTTQNSASSSGGPGPAAPAAVTTTPTHPAAGKASLQPSADQAASPQATITALPQQPVNHHDDTLSSLRESAREKARENLRKVLDKMGSKGQAGPGGVIPHARESSESDRSFNVSRLPRVYVIHHHISDADWPRFYAAVDAFVLPSRGEGWGRPHVEAMAMGLPVISTNWSGITAYLDQSVGYPLTVSGLIPADPAVWWFRGLKWAQPSRSHLTQLLRHVVAHPEEARQKGKAARARMIERYAPEPIAEFMAQEFRRVDALIPQ